MSQLKEQRETSKTQTIKKSKKLNDMEASNYQVEFKHTAYKNTEPLPVWLS